MLAGWMGDNYRPHVSSCYKIHDWLNHITDKISEVCPMAHVMIKFVLDYKKTI